MSRKPPPRDPNAPKRNQSAYLLYQNFMRNTFKEQNPGMSFGQLSKFTSAMYAELTPDEKEVWVQNAERDKQRYLAQLARYRPPPGFDAKGDAKEGYHAVISAYSKTNRASQRDPKAPKRYLSAYLHYQNAMRDTFKEQFPALTFGKLSKYTSQQYKLLTEQERQKWNDIATKDKERYEKEMETYTPPDGYDKNGVMISSKDSKSRKQSRKEKDPDAPKRARTSFMFFTFETRPRILEEFPGIKFIDLGHVMGERWRALSSDEKKRYEDMAEEDKKRFSVEMDAYNAKKAKEEEERKVKEEEKRNAAFYANRAGTMSPRKNAGYAYQEVTDRHSQVQHGYQMQIPQTEQYDYNVSYGQYRNDHYSQQQQQQQQQQVYAQSPARYQYQEQQQQQQQQQTMPHERHEFMSHEREDMSRQQQMMMSPKTRKPNDGFHFA